MLTYKLRTAITSPHQVSSGHFLDAFYHVHGNHDSENPQLLANGKQYNENQKCYSKNATCNFTKQKNKENYCCLFI